MTLEEFVKENNKLTAQIKKLKKQKEKLSNQFNKQLKKEWKKLMWGKDINDIDGERELIIYYN